MSTLLVRSFLPKRMPSPLEAASVYLVYLSRLTTIDGHCSGCQSRGLGALDEKGRKAIALLRSPVGLASVRTLTGYDLPSKALDAANISPNILASPSVFDAGARRNIICQRSPGATAAEGQGPTVKKRVLKVQTIFLVEDGNGTEFVNGTDLDARYAIDCRTGLKEAFVRLVGWSRSQTDDQSF
jgi:hypothetical protein